MKEKKDRRRPSALTVVIRILILLIFCVSIVIAVNRLAEFNHRQKEAGELEQQKEQQQTDGGVAESETP